MSGGPAAAELQAGGRLGPYRLEELLGEGGVGVVFKAVHEPDGAVVALKVLRPELSGDETYRRRFEREGRVASELSHPHLVPVLDAGEVEGHQYLAARYVAGRTLAELLDEDGPLALSPLLRTATEIAGALDRLHREGLVHRDVKPSNIVVDDAGSLFLTDFGLAKGDAATVLTEPGHIVGTLDYVTYECIAGRPPFAGGSFVEATLAILADEPTDPCAGRDDLPPRLSFGVLQALAKRPQDRPATAAAFALMLRVSARPD